MPYWKEFYRQRQALETATLDKEVRSGILDMQFKKMLIVKKRLN